MRRTPLALLATSFAIGMALAGCQTVKDQTAACPVPPAPKPEERPLPPVANYEQTWQPGHWDWNGTGYTWRDGVWIKREGHSSEWMDGYWNRDKSPGPCNWFPAHWM
jgi:hypothetical protein